MTAINIMSLRHSAFYTPLLVCISGGFLKEQGLDPHYEVQTPGRTVDDTLRSGETHLAQSAVATSFAALEMGKLVDIVHFAQINERDGFFLAGRDAETSFDWTTLRGREVLVDHFFQPLAMFKYALHKQGIAFDDIKVIDAGDVAAIDLAFRHGQGDFVHQQGPAPQQLEQDGLGHVVASIGEVVGPVAFSSLCAHRDWLETDMAQSFMQAYRKARQFTIDTSPQELARLIQVFFPVVDPVVLAHTLRTYQQLGCWTPDPTISESAYERLLDVFLYSGVIKKRHPYAAAIVSPPA